MSTTGSMQPPSETPESNVNGMTSSTKPPGSTLKTRARQKKRKKELTIILKKSGGIFVIFIILAPELVAIEKRNWQIHLYYIKRDFDSCKKIIKEQLDDTRGMCEYANYVQVILCTNLVQ